MSRPIDDTIECSGEPTSPNKVENLSFDKKFFISNRKYQPYDFTLGGLSS